MQVLIAAEKLRDKPALEICERYVKRIARFTTIEEIELKDDKSLASRMGKLVGTRDRAIMLETTGQQVDSRGFADVLRAAENDGVQKLVFLLAERLAFPADLKLPNARRLSFSRLTFPYQLMRPLLTEQIYRAYTILKNVPYDH